MEARLLRAGYQTVIGSIQDQMHPGPQNRRDPSHSIVAVLTVPLVPDRRHPRRKDRQADPALGGHQVK